HGYRHCPGGPEESCAHGPVLQPLSLVQEAPKPPTPAPMKGSTQKPASPPLRTKRSQTSPAPQSGVLRQERAIGGGWQCVPPQVAPGGQARSATGASDPPLVR